MYLDSYQIAEIRTVLFMYYHHACYIPSGRRADVLFRIVVWITLVSLVVWMVGVLVVFPDLSFKIKVAGGVAIIIVCRVGCVLSFAVRRFPPPDDLLQQEAETLAEALPVLDGFEQELLDELLRAMRFWQTVEIAAVLDRISSVSELAHWPLVVKLRSIIIR